MTAGRVDPAAGQADERQPRAGVLGLLKVVVGAGLKRGDRSLTRVRARLAAWRMAGSDRSSIAAISACEWPNASRRT